MKPQVCTTQSAAPCRNSPTLLRRSLQDVLILPRILAHTDSHPVCSHEFPHHLTVCTAEKSASCSLVHSPYAIFNQVTNDVAPLSRENSSSHVKAVLWNAPFTPRLAY